MEDLKDFVGINGKILWKQKEKVDLYNKIKETDKKISKRLKRIIIVDIIFVLFCIGLFYGFIVRFPTLDTTHRVVEIPEFIFAVVVCIVMFIFGISEYRLFVITMKKGKEVTDNLFKNLSVEVLENYHDYFILSETHIITRSLINNSSNNVFFTEMYKNINDICEKKSDVERTLLKALKKIEIEKIENEKLNFMFYFLSKNHEIVKEILYDENNKMKKELNIGFDFKGFDYVFGNRFTEKEMNELIPLLKQSNPHLEIIDI